MDEEILFVSSQMRVVISDISPSCVGMDEEIEFRLSKRPEDILTIRPNSVGGWVGGCQLTECKNVWVW